MTNQLMTQRPSLSELGLPGMGFFSDSILDRFLNLPFNQPNLMRQYRKEDGSRVVEYNLAGYAEEEISVNIDTALGELLVKAEHAEDGNMRRFSTALSLSPYTSHEDINVSYKNGVLIVEVAPLEKRKQEALVSLPVNNKSPKTIEQEEKD